MSGTVKEIQQYVKEHDGFVPKTCWIAEVKEECGIPVAAAWNRAGPERQEKCPTEIKKIAIRKALAHFGLI